MKTRPKIKSLRSTSKSLPRRQTVDELRKLQRLMAGAVMRSLTPAQRMQPEWASGARTADVVAGFIKPNDRLTSFQRLEIYNRQYWFRLIDCFYDDYPGLRAVLGQNRFHRLAVAYLTRFPSASFTLRNLGRNLVEFIQPEPRWTAPRHDLALDMARLEWAHIEAFDNEAKPPVSADDLLGRKPEGIYLGLQSYVTLLQLGFPLDDYLISVRRETGLRGEASNAMGNAESHSRSKKWRPPEPRPIWLAVHRYRNVVHYKRLTRVQFDVLKALADGKSLENALQRVTGPAAARVAKWFENWSALGWFWLSRKKEIEPRINANGRE